MIENTVQVPTDDGIMECFVVSPKSPEPCPPVILYMDAPGIREELRQFSRRIAAEGYTCWLPDLYYRSGHVRFDLSKKTDAMFQEIMGEMHKINPVMIMRDTQKIIEAIDDNPKTARQSIACLGYCMSGQYVVSALGQFPERFKAGVSCYGVGIVTPKPDSPHLLAPAIKGELYLAIAEYDEYVPNSDITSVEKVFKKHKVNYQLKIYPGTSHGFCFPERKGLYQKSGAEDVWSKTFQLFQRTLKSV